MRNLINFAQAKSQSKLYVVSEPNKKHDFSRNVDNIF